MRVWLVATGMLGIIFLSGQVFEFTEFVEEGLTVTTSPFGSSFFVLTGFHGAHVAVGVLMLLATALMSFTGSPISGIASIGLPRTEPRSPSNPRRT